MNHCRIFDYSFPHLLASSCINKAIYLRYIYNNNTPIIVFCDKLHRYPKALNHKLSSCDRHHQKAFFPLIHSLSNSFSSHTPRHHPSSLLMTYSYYLFLSLTNDSVILLPKPTLNTNHSFLYSYLTLFFSYDGKIALLYRRCVGSKGRVWISFFQRRTPSIMFQS